LRKDLRAGESEQHSGLDMMGVRIGREVANGKPALAIC
jgi:hypothetical protein